MSAARTPLATSIATPVVASVVALGMTCALAAAAAAAPDQPMIAVELARLQMKAKRTGDAIATLARARARWPDHPQVWLASGDLLAASDPGEAGRAYLRAIRLAPDDERAYLC